MKKLILILMVGSLFANEAQTVEVINITKKSKVEVYTALFWAPCKEAKALLQSRGIDYTEKKITFSRKGTAELAELSGGNTYTPQLIVDGKYFGGLKKLRAYFKELDK